MFVPCQRRRSNRFARFASSGSRTKMDSRFTAKDCQAVTFWMRSTATMVNRDLSWLSRKASTTSVFSGPSLSGKYWATSGSLTSSQAAGGSRAPPEPPRRSLSPLSSSAVGASV